jgi:hypothetical protein
MLIWQAPWSRKAVLFTCSLSLPHKNVKMETIAAFIENFFFFIIMRKNYNDYFNKLK